MWLIGPLSSQRRWAQRLLQHDYSPVFFPLLHLQSVCGPIEDYQREKYDAAAFASPMAVHLFSRMGIPLNQENTPVWAIGSETSAALRDIGVEGRTPSAQPVSGENLARALKQEGYQKVLVPAAKESLFEKALQKEEVFYKKWTLYETNDLLADISNLPMEVAKQDEVLITSPSGVLAFYKACQKFPQLQRLSCVATGGAVCPHATEVPMDLSSSLMDITPQQASSTSTQREALTSPSLFERAKSLTVGGVHSPVRAFQAVGGSPLFFKRGRGAYLWEEGYKERMYI